MLLCRHYLRPRCKFSSSVRFLTGHDPVVLRPYQEHCLDACTGALTEGVSRIGVSLPTGSGKTTVFVSLLSRISPLPAFPHATRSLIIVNSIELAHQTASSVTRIFPSWSVEIEQGAKYKATGFADVTVATIQTLLRSDRLSKFDPRLTKAVVVDEAHHAAAPSYRKLLSHFDSDIKHPDSPDAPSHPYRVPIFGFSATFSRHDGLALGSVFEKIVYHRDFLEMVKEQWLCNVKFTSVKAKLNLKEVTTNNASGDFNATSLANVVNTDVVNNLIVQSWLDRASHRKSTLVFCVNISHVKSLTTTFRGFGIDARYIYADTPPKERATLVADFKAQRFPVLVNCAILTEGADVPNIDCVVVARPTRSRNVFAQMIGRGMRLSAATGKEDCHIIDFVDSTTRVPGVVSSPSLFGLDPDDMHSETMTMGDMEALAIAKEEEDSPDSRDDIPSPHSVTYIDYADPFMLIEDTSGARHINQLTRNGWVGCGADIYVLECLGKGYIRVEPKYHATEPQYFEGYFTPAIVDMTTAKSLKVSPYMTSRRILSANTLEEAIRGCDTYATSKVVFGPMILGLLRSAKWRQSPATDNQKNFLKKRWSTRNKDKDPEAWELEMTDRFAKLTKGQAANMITRLKHGAAGRYEKVSRDGHRITKKLEKERKRQARTVVREGPLSAV